MRSVFATFASFRAVALPCALVWMGCRPAPQASPVRVDEGADERVEPQAPGPEHVGAPVAATTMERQPRILFEQPPVGDPARVGLGFFTHDGSGQRRNHVHADDFVLERPASITHLRWWGLSDNTRTTGLDNFSAFVVRLHRMSDTMVPEAIVFERRYAIAETSMQATGRKASGIGEASKDGLEYMHTVVVDPPLAIEAKRAYAFSVAAVRRDGAGDNWQWQDGRTQVGASWSHPLDQPTWQRIDDVDSAFALLGWVHEAEAK